jgi:hypothetical protein
VLALSIAYPQLPGVPPTSLAPHLEMWAHVNDDGGSRYVRLTAQVGTHDPAQEFTGFAVVRAIDPNDRCLIRGLDLDDEVCASPDTATDAACGTQMFSKLAQKVPEGSTAELEQLGLVLQVRKVTSADVKFNAYDPTVTGRAPNPLLALVPFNPDFANDPRLRLPATDVNTAADLTVAKQRLTQCVGYRDKDQNRPNPYFYVGNPRQYTKPIAGNLYGFFSFATCTTASPPTCPIATPDLPVQNFSGINFSVPTDLSTIDSLLITVEGSINPSAPTLAQTLYTSALDPTCKVTTGRTVQPDGQAGRGVLKFLMCVNTNPMLFPAALTLAGSATVLTGLGGGLD